MKIFNKINPRYIGATLATIIVLPIIIMAGLHSTPTRSVAIVLFTFVGMYTIWEFTKHMELHKVTKLLLPLAIIPFMLIDEQFITIRKIIPGNGLSYPLQTKGIEGLYQVIMHAIPLYSLACIVIVSILALIDPVSRKNFSPYKTFLLVFISIALPALFFKTIFIFTAINPIWLSVIIPTAIISDTFAYFGGMLGHKKFPKKFVPNISPKKTWIGFWTGYIAAVVYLGLLLGLDNKVILSSKPHEWTRDVMIVSIVLILPLISPMGDLGYSAFKRSRNIKDFSKLIPGHGGILDRVDSWIVITITFLIILQIFG